MHESFDERDHVWMGAVKKDVLLVLHIISLMAEPCTWLSLAQVTSRVGIVNPGHSFDL